MVSDTCLLCTIEPLSLILEVEFGYHLPKFGLICQDGVTIQSVSDPKIQCNARACENGAARLTLSSIKCTPICNILQTQRLRETLGETRASKPVIVGYITDCIVYLKYY